MTVATFVVVPQWQGSVSARAMNLINGADAIRGDLPTSATVVVEVPMEAGDEIGTGVRRFSTIQRINAALSKELTRIPGLAITIGGDCGVSLAAVAHAQQRHGDIAILWLDAHPDLNVPGSSPSGGFGGMVLRAILGDGAEPLALRKHLIPVERVVIAGARAIDTAEKQFIQDTEIAIFAEIGEPTPIISALAATGTRNVYVHIDLDVLDPAAIAGLSFPVPFGAGVAQLVALLRTVVSEFSLVGATIAGFAPTSPQTSVDDLPTILRLIGALTRPESKTSDASYSSKSKRKQT